MKTRRFVLASLAGLALLVLYWIFDPGTDTEAAKKEAPGGASAVHPDRDDTGLVGKQEQAIKAPVREELTSRTAAPGRLALKIIKEDGEPAQGSVFWTTSQTPFRSSSLMAPEQGHQLPGDVQSTRHHGSARLEIPAGHWTWLRVTDHGADHFTTSAYARIKPFAGQHKKQFRLSRKKRSLHVFLLQANHAAAAGQNVRLYSRDMSTRAPAVLLGKEQTDEWGYACFRELLPGNRLRVSMTNWSGSRGRSAACTSSYCKRTMLHQHRDRKCVSTRGT